MHSSFVGNHTLHCTIEVGKIRQNIYKFRFRLVQSDRLGCDLWIFSNMEYFY